MIIWFRKGYTAKKHIKQDKKKIAFRFAAMKIANDYFNLKPEVVQFVFF